MSSLASASILISLRTNIGPGQDASAPKCLHLEAYKHNSQFEQAQAVAVSPKAETIMNIQSRTASTSPPRQKATGLGAS
jgi:hypothetical protein